MTIDITNGLNLNFQHKGT